MKVLTVGQYVKHYRYGFGLVIQSDNDETSIQFQLHGSKNFVTALMVVEVSDLTPPQDFRNKWIKAASHPSSRWPGANRALQLRTGEKTRRRRKTEEKVSSK
jgi:hypothetical protein